MGGAWCSRRDSGRQHRARTSKSLACPTIFLDKIADLGEFLSSTTQKVLDLKKHKVCNAPRSCLSNRDCNTTLSSVASTGAQSVTPRFSSLPRCLEVAPWASLFSQHFLSEQLRAFPALDFSRDVRETTICLPLCSSMRNRLT